MNQTCERCNGELVEEWEVAKRLCDPCVSIADEYAHGRCDWDDYTVQCVQQEGNTDDKR